MIIVGGTYDEVCFEPKWDYKFGSGLRGAFTVQGINKAEKVDFYSFGNKNTKSYLELLETDSFKSFVYNINFSIRFEYDFPLSVPHIYPRLDILSQDIRQLDIEAKEENILYYGMLEGNACIHGNKVVYDPQSPANPKTFSSTGSSAKELAIVLNLSEAKLLSGENDLNLIADYFFNKEKVALLILKMGAKGAFVYTSASNRESIPVYKTNEVWPIGSGDVFAASFAYYWFHGVTPVDAAKYASWNTACYCNSKSYTFKEFENGEFEPLVLGEIPLNQIYLAGPFFTFTQRWLVNQVYMCMKGMNLNVFSPWHDVGHGEASFVVPLDLDGLDKSVLIFAILDGLDSGTLFELGYANAKGIKSIGYVENESSEDVKMLVGTNCILENDLTTAIYKTLWAIME